MSSQAHHIRRLATALAAGPMEDREALVARAKPLVGDLRKARWLAPLARKLSLEFGEAPRPTVRRIAERIRAHEGFVKAWAEGRGRISIGQVAPQMAPAAGAPRTVGNPGNHDLGRSCRHAAAASGRSRLADFPWQGGALSPSLAGEAEERALPLDREPESAAQVRAAAGAAENPPRHPAA